MTREEILREATETYGLNAQEDMMIEEMSELTKALLKLRREDSVQAAGATGKCLKDNIREEIADVQIMLDQMRIFYGSTDEWEQYKLQRLAERLGLVYEEVPE